MVETIGISVRKSSRPYDGNDRILDVNLKVRL
jgi:hypothetical protein